MTAQHQGPGRVYTKNERSERRELTSTSPISHLHVKSQRACMYHPIHTLIPFPFLFHSSLITKARLPHTKIQTIVHKCSFGSLPVPKAMRSKIMSFSEFFENERPKLHGLRGLCAYVGVAHVLSLRSSRKRYQKSQCLFSAPSLGKEKSSKKSRHVLEGLGSCYIYLYF